MKHYYYQDESGQWWMQNTKQRTRAEICKCDLCGTEFPRATSVKKRYKKCFCSKPCANEGNKDIQSITKRGENNPAWKGGRIKDAKGYIKIKVYDHPYASKYHKHVCEHRIVMEQYLGRYLLPTETVHHKNGIRDDNRIENLELMHSSHPAGQRPEDLVEWALKIIELYGDDPKQIKLTPNNKTNQI
jgi:hypothetical protein